MIEIGTKMKNRPKKPNKMMSEDQIQFDEDSLLSRKAQKKTLTKNGKVRSQKSDRKSAYHMKREGVEKMVDVLFNFDDNYFVDFSIKEIDNIKKCITTMYGITDDNINIYEVIVFMREFPQFVKCKKHFISYCMYVYNVLRSYSTVVELPEESHTGYCDVCMDTKNDMKVLKCNHSFCVSCLTGSFNKKLTPACPMCRGVPGETVISIDREKFVKPLSPEDYYDLINTVTDFVTHHNRKKIGTQFIVYYFAKERGYDVSHSGKYENEEQYKLMIAPDTERSDIWNRNRKIMDSEDDGGSYYKNGRRFH